MAGIRIEIKPDRADLKRLQDAMRRLAKVGRSPRRPLGRIGLFVRREAVRSLRSRPRDWGPPTGRLAKSLAMRLGETEVAVGSNLVYAAVQQLGGTVRPKTVKYLAIPVLAHLRRRGVWPRDLPRGSLKFKGGQQIRIGSHSWVGPALVRAESADGDAGQAGKKKRRTRGKAGEVMFALIRKATIRGRPYLTFDKPAQRFALAEFRREYEEAIRGR